MRRPGVLLAAAAGLLTAMLAVPALADDASPSPSPLPSAAPASPSPTPPPSPGSSASPSESVGATGSSSPSGYDLALRAWVNPKVAYQGDTVTLSVRVSRKANTPDGEITVQIWIGQLAYAGADDDACRDDAQGMLHCPLPAAGTTKTLHVRFHIGYVPVRFAQYGIPVNAGNPHQYLSRHPVVTLRNPSIKPSPSFDYYQLRGHYEPSTAKPGDKVKLWISARGLVDGTFYVSGAPLTFTKCSGDYERCAYDARHSTFTCELPENSSGPCILVFRVTSCPGTGKITQHIVIRNSHDLFLASTSATLTCRTGSVPSASVTGTATGSGGLPVTGMSLPLYGALASALLAGGAGLIILARRRRARTGRG